MRSSDLRVSLKSLALVGTTITAIACGGRGCAPDGTTANLPGGADPRAAKTKQLIVLDIHQMSNTPAVPLSIRTADKNEVKLEDLFEPAGITLQVRRNDTALPHAPEVTLANLHAMMLANRSHKPVPADAIAVQLIVATKEAGRPRDLGIMFDYGDTDTDNLPREGFAVFADIHENLAAGRDPELMLTVAHELTHVLNLHHADWEPGQAGGNFDKGSTIESYSTAGDVKWALSERSKQHLLNDPPKEKWPGRDNLGFGFLVRDHFKRHQAEPADETWSVIEASGLAEKGRHARAAVEQAARAVPRDRTNVLPSNASPVTLKLEVPRTRVEKNEALTMVVGLHNTGPESMHVRPLLDPSYGFLNVEIQLPGSDVFLPFRPALLREARGVTTEMIAADGELHDEAKVFFGANGWTFSRPGSYRIRADFPAPASSREAALAAKQRIGSNIVEIEVVEARTAASRSTITLLSSFAEGLNLLVGATSPQIDKAAAVPGASAQADAARLAVISAAAAQLSTEPGTASAAVNNALKYAAETTPTAVGPFSFAQTYDQLANALEKAGRQNDAADVRQRLTSQIQKLEAAPDVMKRIKAPQ